MSGRAETNGDELPSGHGAEQLTCSDQLKSTNSKGNINCIFGLSWILILIKCNPVGLDNRPALIPHFKEVIGQAK